VKSNACYIFINSKAGSSGSCHEIYFFENRLPVHAKQYNFVNTVCTIPITAISLHCPAIIQLRNNNNNKNNNTLSDNNNNNSN
jgi:hypothetical protein